MGSAVEAACSVSSLRVMHGGGEGGSLISLMLILEGWKASQGMHRPS